jgi:deoxycytidylate deaminase
MLSRREAAFLSVARYLAAKSKSRKKHGAVLVRSGRVVGTGYNRERNSPFVVSPEHIKPHCSRHAEFLAIREAGSNANGAILYVARVNKQGKDRISKPCRLCQVEIDKSNIKRVIYTRDEP